MERATQTPPTFRLAGAALVVLLGATAASIAGFVGTRTEGASAPAWSQSSANCPTEPPLDPGRHARDKAIAAVRESLRTGQNEWRRYKIASAYPAASSQGFGAIVYNWCGRAVGSRTWIVEMHFPNLLPSATLSQGQAFVSRFRSGWRVWYRYH
jgi:hypothetical protein